MGLRMRLLVFGLCPFDISSTGRVTCQARMQADLLGRVSSSSMRAALSIWPASSSPSLKEFVPEFMSSSEESPA